MMPRAAAAPGEQWLVEAPQPGLAMHDPSPLQASPAVDGAVKDNHASVVQAISNTCLRQHQQGNEHG